MKEFVLEVFDKKIRYEVQINNKFNVIAGFSGTGKTTLYALVQRAAKGVYGTGFISELPLLAGASGLVAARAELSTYSNHLIVLDEECDLLNPPDKNTQVQYADILKKSPNVFLLITRNTLNLALPQNSYLNIFNNGKVNKVLPAYPKLDNILSLNEKYITITEDGSSSFKFLVKINQYTGQEGFVRCLPYIPI